jgi:hypothetical protein
LPFQHRQWLAQRVGWALGIAILVLGGLGLFGGGPLSEVTAGTPALRVEYERFLRRDSPTELRVDARPVGDQVRLAVSREYLHALRIESILPYPERLEETDREVILAFRAAPRATSLRITFNVTPLHVGALHAQVRAAAANPPAPVRIDQFTYP